MMWGLWNTQLLGILDQLLYYTAHYADVADVSDNAVREETWTVVRAYTVPLNDADTGVINVTINESQRDQRVWVESVNTTGQSNTWAKFWFLLCLVIPACTVTCVFY